MFVYGFDVLFQDPDRVVRGQQIKIVLAGRWGMGYLDGDLARP